MVGVSSRHDDRGQAVDQIGAAPADLVGVDSGAHAPRRVDKAAERRQQPGVRRQEADALGGLVEDRRGVGDDEQARLRRGDEQQQHRIVLPGAEHRARRPLPLGHRVGGGSRLDGWGAGQHWPIVAGRSREQLGGRDDHDREEDSQPDKAAGDAVVGDQVLGRRRNVNRRRAVAAHHQAGDESATVRAKPFHRGRRGRRVAESHPDAAQARRIRRSAPVAAAQAGQDAPAAEKHSAQGRAQSRAEPILQQPAGNHEKGERDAANCVGPGRLCVRQVKPTLVEPAPSPCRADARRCRRGSPSRCSTHTGCPGRG